MTPDDDSRDKAAPGAGHMPHVRAIGFGDIAAALRAGWHDFRQAPLYGLFFGSFYAGWGILIAAMLSVLDMAYLVFPVSIGFVLIGPFVAVGLYEVSRRLERGEALTWGGVLGVIWLQRQRELVWMAFVMLFVFWVWMYQVRLLLALFLGFQSFSDMAGFLRIVLTTYDGWWFLLVGHVVGAVLSLVLFSVTVIACPLLLDREVDFITAIITSVKTVTTSGPPMIAWGLCVVAAMIAASLPAFLGLLVVLPVLGHTTWHLYRRAVIAPPLT
jgi:uncharacterized membrane protein